MLLFKKNKLHGAFSIILEKNEDNRGFFARVWDVNEFKKKNLNTKFVQWNSSFSKKKGTLRGLHYQKHPFGETKLFRCTRGSIYHVMIDLRRPSPSFMQWDGIELNEKNCFMRYVPKGFATGIISLEDNSEIFYQSSQFYHPESEEGIMWNDPTFNIKWPIQPKIISKKDNSWKTFSI